MSNDRSMKWRGTTRRLIGNRRGAAALEMGLLFPLFMMFLYGLIEVPRLILAQVTIEMAVQEASRWAAANPSAATNAVVNVARGRLTAIDGDAVTVTAVKEAAVTGNPPFLVVTARMAYRPLLPLLPQALTSGASIGAPGSIPLSARIRMPVLS